MDLRLVATIRFVLLAAAFLLGTVALGWWSVPILGAVWGVAGRDTPRPAVTAGLAAASSWALLLWWSATMGPVGVLADKLGAIAHAPGLAFVGLALALPLLLAATAARVVRPRA